MSEDPNKRLARGTLAFALAIPARIVTQVASLPILFSFWSPDRVGAWLGLFALPAYLTVVGSSFSGAAGSAALAAVRESNWQLARAHFRASWALLTLLTIGLLGLALLAAEGSIENLSRDFALPPDIALRPVLWGLALYVLAVSQMGALNLAFRVVGQYPQHSLIQTATNLLDVAVLAVCVSQSTSLALLAFALAAMRGVAALVTAIWAWRIAPQMFHRETAPLRPAIGELWRPSLALMIIPVVYAINIQGYSLLVGAYFGTVVLATFVATRTLVRLIDLVTGVIYSVQFYEAGYSDLEQSAVMRRQLATMTLITLAIVIGTGAVMLAAGEWLQSLLSAGKTEFDRTIAIILIVSGAIRALATTPQALLIAHNRHVRLTVTYLIGSLACFALAIALASMHLPLALILLVLIPAEFFSTLPSFNLVLRELGWNWRGLLRALVSRQRFVDMAKLARIVGRPL